MTQPKTHHESKGRTVAVMALLAGAVCCGLPVVVAAGSSITLLGLGLRSWLLVTAGMTVIVATIALARRSRREHVAPKR